MKLLHSFLLVGTGGLLGAGVRFGVTLLLLPLQTAVPLNTLLVNFLGCFIVGAGAALMTASFDFPKSAQLLVITGFCGACTTMSAFIFEVDRLVKAGSVFLALGYLGLTLAGCYGLFRAGEYTARALWHL